MRFANRLLVFVLIAAISILTGGQAGRAGVHDARAIEICAENAITIIYVDAQGRQVPSAPICDCAACKHCAVPALALLPMVATVASLSRHAHPHLATPKVFSPLRTPWSHQLARGPPPPKGMK
ncbi:hypothetical protein [Paracoccus xiamenensis]|uniref:hypothetical protein n=1 Tax=Paracoccus xiamenensis TaxID=2714901 RepID=UPI00140D9737|nr:hypothetical protein [Paracoccus xiamenensis]NHF74104.1 hypothetical protein [Paracoccus xiamenensis]